MSRPTLTLNPAALLGRLSASIQRYTNLVSLGLTSVESAELDRLSLPGAFFQFSGISPDASDEDAASVIQAAKADFPAWLLGAGLRDCIEETGPVLEEARMLCSLFELVRGRGGVPAEEWNEWLRARPNEDKRFQGLNFPDKIEALTTTHGLVIPPAATESVLSINRARNCLVHRRGVVSTLDTKSDPSLTVAWRKLELVLMDDTGERVFVPPALVERDGEIGIREAGGSKVFALGEKVSFDAQEFSEICWTLFVFGQAIVTELDRRVRESVGSDRQGDAPDTGSSG